MSQPDIITTKNGVEVRGVFWKDDAGDISYFNLAWDEENRTLSLEVADGPIAQDLTLIFENALGVPSRTSLITGASGRRPSREWVIPLSGKKVMSDRLGEVLGREWREAIDELVTSRSARAQLSTPQPWFGIPREEIPWFPMLDTALCNGCRRCFEYCRHNVFNMVDDPPRAEVASPLNCVVGCNSCSLVCPAGAIEFPPREILQELRSKH